MKYIPSIAFEEMSGSAKGVTLNPLFVEMKLNNYNFETIGAKLSRTAQAVSHWFLEDEIAVSMLFKFANAMEATLELVPEVKGEKLII